MWSETSLEALEALTVIDEPLRVLEDDDERTTEPDVPVIEDPTTIYDRPARLARASRKIPMLRDLAASPKVPPPFGRRATSHELDASYEAAMRQFM